MQKILLYCSFIAAAIAIYFAFQSIRLSNQRQNLSYDLAELLNIKYGLLNADLWKEKAAAFLQKKIESFSLDADNRALLKKGVEYGLYRMADQLDSLLKAEKNSADWQNKLKSVIKNVPKTDPEYGKRRKDKDGNYMTVKAINYAGLKVQLKGSQSEGLNTTGLTGFDKFLQDFNSLLFNGIMEHIRYGDKSSSYGTKFDKFLYSGSSLPINIDYFGKAFFKDDKYESLPIEFTRYMKNKMANEILAMRLAEEGIGKNILNYKDKLDNWQIFDGIEGFDTLLDKIKKSGMLTKEAYNNKEAILTALEQYSDEINTNLGRYF